MVFLFWENKLIEKQTNKWTHEKYNLKILSGKTLLSVQMLQIMHPFPSHICQTWPRLLLKIVIEVYKFGMVC